jgi:ribose transport system ATP-binding protein
MSVARPIEQPPPCEAPASAPLFELRCISKTFPGVKALDDVSFSVWPGEVHMLVGENGAGKSSLMKVLCGAYRADAGEFFHRGEKVAIQSSADAKRLGIAVIFQEFSLVPYLDIAQNIFLGREPKGRIPGTIDRRELLRDAKRVLDSIGFNIDPTIVAAKLGVAQQQMVEIAKAVSQNARIIVMDEPTAALSDRESELLFALIRELKADGVAIIYISHRMAEVFALGDRITVLRDGRRVGEADPATATANELVRMMVGRSVDISYPRQFAESPGKVLLEVKGLSALTGIADINLVVRQGEIVGLCGLVGSGRSEVARAIFGADPATAGSIVFDGREKTGGPDEAARLGLALIPESRKAEGLALPRSVSDNLVVSALRKLFPSGAFRPRQAQRTADDLIGKLRIATPSARQTVALLSGGNQQKVVIGKWLAAGARLFIFDEPTRGIDVGAKAEIFALIDRVVAGGAAALMISSEQAEICHVCDRAYVMREGRIAGELSRTELTEENIVRLGMHHA